MVLFNLDCMYCKVLVVFIKFGGCFVESVLVVIDFVIDGVVGIFGLGLL